MIKDKTLQQEGGDKSQNFQAENIYQTGLSYQDARDISNDVFQSNFLKLSEAAAQKATERAQQLFDDFLKKIDEKNPNLLNAVETPAMQHALFTASKGYAISGDKAIEEMLVDILVERCQEDGRSLKQIVLDESLDVLPKLTDEQLDILSLIFALGHSVRRGIGSLEDLKKYLETEIQPFVHENLNNLSSYQHLEYCNCGTVSRLGTSDVDGTLRITYLGLFMKGKDLDEVTTILGDVAEYQGLLIPCLHDPAKLQPNALNRDTLEKKIAELNLDEAKSTKLLHFFDTSGMSQAEVREILLQQGDFMERLFTFWKTSPLGRMSLTSVGIALAQANYRRKTGVTMDLSIWVK